LPLTPYITFTREEWKQYRDGAPLTLSEADLQRLSGLNENVSLIEVEEIYLPLSRLLNLYIAATQGLHKATATFLGKPMPNVPYIIGLAGSVAVGKSTTARILQALLSRWGDHTHVALVPTDGFLYPNKTLEKMGLMERKGFPESYDIQALLQFVSDVKAGQSPVFVPVYSHIIYDIVPGEFTKIERPEVIILEGLNVLQAGTLFPDAGSRLFVSDFFDFSIYVDAKSEVIEQWFLKRFFTLRDTAFQDPQSFFHQFANLSDAEARDLALEYWRGINELNLRENILPTRERADLIIEKGPDHSVEKVRLRKL